MVGGAGIRRPRGAKLWSDVDAWLVDTLGLSDPALDAALASSEAAGLPDIHVSPPLGQWLRLLVETSGARRVLEVGTLAGYSTIWLARGLAAGGRLVSLELEPDRARLARRNVARAGLGKRVEIRVGNALDLLPRLDAEGAGPFDLIFLDADKPALPAYLDWALRLARPGGLLVVDNVVRKGRVADQTSTAADVRGVRELLERMGAESRLRTTVIQTVGMKGYDGLAIARVVDRPSGGSRRRRP